jgi:hypothetical protein
VKSLVVRLQIFASEISNQRAASSWAIKVDVSPPSCVKIDAILSAASSR